MPTAKQSPLGRGLSSLIPDKKQKARPALNPSDDLPASQPEKSAATNNGGENYSGENNLLMIHPDLIEANPLQPRVTFNEKGMRELINSVQEHGIIQPLVVTKKKNGGYQLIVGERRLRAAKELGLSAVPVILKEADERGKLEIALIENIIREDLNPIETAMAYKKLIEEFGVTHEEAANRVGKTRSIVTNSLRLLTLPEEIKQGLREGKISDAHGVVIAGLDSKEKQMEIYHAVVKRRLSVNRTRREIEKIGGSKKARLKIDPRDEEVMKKLRQFFGTRVDIYRAGYGGKITIDFYNYDEMLEIVNKMLGGFED